MNRDLIIQSELLLLCTSTNEHKSQYGAVTNQEANCTVQQFAV